MHRPRQSSALPPGLFFESRPALAEPGVDLGRVARRRPDLRLLDALAARAQQAIDVGEVRADSDSALDHRNA